MRKEIWELRKKEQKIAYEIAKIFFLKTNEIGWKNEMDYRLKHIDLILNFSEADGPYLKKPPAQL